MQHLILKSLYIALSHSPNPLCLSPPPKSPYQYLSTPTFKPTHTPQPQPLSSKILLSRLSPPFYQPTH
ncbi:hypothetical protein, partial [Siminovitchia fortis]|uniref:hypothetical protein n=1 Tax=Siminovitchia fortis TaxID=254758 RepID=UPI001C92EDE0